MGCRSPTGLVFLCSTGPWKISRITGRGLFVLYAGILRLCKVFAYLTSYPFIIIG